MKRKFFLIAVAAMVFLLSCKQNATTGGLPVPKDASMVLHVNTSAITSKLSWEEIKGSTWFRENLEKENDSFTRKIMENPEASGVDVKSDFVFFIKKQGKGGYAVAEGKLKDVAAFEALLKKNQPDEAIQKDGEFRHIKTGEKSLVSWTDDRFFALSDAPIFNMTDLMGNRGNREPMNFSLDSLKKFSKDLASLKSDYSIDNDSRFKDLVKEEGEVHFWLNYEQFGSSLGGGMMSMMKVSDLFKDMAGTFTLNFDKGKIVVKSKWYFNKQMEDLLDKYKSGNISQGLIDRIPFSNPSVIFGMNYDPRLIKEMLTLSGFDGMANGFLGDLNLTLDEVIGSIKGEFLFAASDFSMKEKEVTIPMGDANQTPYTYKTKQQDMNYIFATSLNNRQSFDKMLKIAEEKMGRMPDAFTYKVNNEWFASSNKPETVDQFLAGGDHNIPVADKLSGHPFVFYVDIQKILQGVGKELENATDSAEYAANTGMWQDITATGGDFKNGTATYEMVVNMVDKNTNSLKQLNQYADKMAAARKLRKSQWDMNSMDVDTTVAPPVVTPQ